MEKGLYIVLMIIFELYEASWQKSSTFKGMIENILKRYQKGQINFFLSHPSYWYILFVVFKLNILNFWITVILFLKTIDIVFKLWLIQSYLKGNNIIDSMVPKNMKISPNLIYLNLVFYAALFYFAIY